MQRRGWRFTRRRRGLRRLQLLDLFDLQSASLVNVLAQAQAEQRLEGGFNHIRGILRTHRFAEDIFNSSRLEHRAHRLAGDNPGAGRSGPKQYFGPTIMREDFVWDGRILQGNANHLRAGQFTAFANGIGHLTGFAQTHANAAAFVPYDDQGAEIEPASAFNHLGGAVDEHNLLGQFLSRAIAGRLRGWAITPAAESSAAFLARFGLLLFDLLRFFRGLAVLDWIWFSHNNCSPLSSKFQTGFAGGIGKGF